MRHSRVLLLLAAVASPMLHFACTDSDEADPKLNVDGGLPTTDGSVSNTDGQVLPDVVIPNDVQVDAGPQPVTVRALSKGLPAAGVTIVWQDANGAVVDTSTTDAQGLASKLVASGTMVTAILGTAEQPRLVTVLAVEPGDVLNAIDSTEDTNAGQNYGNVDLETLPANPPVGISGYEAHSGPCQTDFASPLALPRTVSSGYSCQHDGRTSILVIAEDVNGDRAFSFAKNITLDTDGGDVPARLDGGTWTDTPTHRITVVNGQADAGNATVVAAEWSSGVKLARSTQLETTDGGAQSTDFKVHPGYADTTVAEAHYAVFSGPASSHRGVAMKAGTDGGTVLDFAGALPFIRTTERDGGADAGPHSVSWTADGPLSGADGAFVRINWSDDLGDAGFVSGVWTFVAPPTTTRITLPSMPAALSARAPSDNAFIGSSPVVVFFESANLAGYADVRKAAAALPPTFDLASGNSYNGLMPELPVDGVVNFTAITDNGD